MDHQQDDRETSAAPGATRRRLLHAAAGGLALAASGLFLPTGLGETVAQEGALNRNGDKQGKGQDHRPPGAGGSLIRFVALRAVARDLAPATISVDFSFRVKRGLDEFGPLVFAKSAEGLMIGNVDYAPERYAIAAYIHGDALPTPVFIEIRNVLFHGGVPALAPFGTIAKGGAVDSNGQYVGGATLYSGEHMRTRTFDIGTWHGPSGVQREMWLEVKRLPTSDTHYWLQAAIYWR